MTGSTFGPGWQKLLDQFAEDLAKLDPGAVATATGRVYGGPILRVRCTSCCEPAA